LNNEMITPVLLRTDSDSEWPDGERMFYEVASDGLYLCRNTEFFRSSVKARGGPGELEPGERHFEPKFPLLPQALIEKCVGFFDRIAELHDSEAAALFLWDRNEACVRLVVPEQTATVYRGWSGSQYAIGVHYQIPTQLPPHWVPFGDIHCHVDSAAYSSYIDKQDELHSAGLHVVIGRIRSEPPEIHVEAVVDGERFDLRADSVIEGYARRDLDVPEAWIDRVKVSTSSSAWDGRSWRASS
jgi:hypothetical protein